MTFGENLKALRKARGLTQEEFAKQSGISRSAIGMYESGKREPKNFEMLETIADFFNVDMNTLLGTSDAPAPAAEPMGLTARDERDIEHFDLATYIQNHDALRYDGSTYRLNDEDRKALDTVVRLALRNVPANE